MKICQLLTPPTVYAGMGSIEKLQEILQKAHAKSVLLFTGKALRDLGITARAEEICQQVSCRIVDNLAIEPSVQDVEKVIAEAQGETYDVVIGIGGGSVMDAAKLASLLVGANYTLRDLLQDVAPARKHIKSVMIPTTCGTGSEATCNAIVAIPEQETKQGIVSMQMIPDAVILDPAMIARLPQAIIASTGIDALAHNVECFTSNKATALSDTYAREGARKIFHYIRRAYDNPDDMEAKSEMLLGAFYGGIAITGSGTTAVHALSYPLGGKYHIAHGVSNAILFAHVMAFNQDGCQDRLAALADAVFPEHYKESALKKAEFIIHEIAAIVHDTHIPTDLKQFGVKAEDLDFLVESGSQQKRLLNNNCKSLSLADIRGIYQKVL